MTHRILTRNGQPRDDTPSNRDSIRIQLWTSTLTGLMSHPIQSIADGDGRVSPESIRVRANDSIAAANDALAAFDEAFPG